MSIQAIQSSTATDLYSLLKSQSATESVSATQMTTSTQTTSRTSSASGGGGVKATGGGGGGGGGSSSSSTDTSQIYDPMDTNKDGTVSYQERMMYEITHPSEAESSDEEQLISTSQLNAALKAYQQD